MIKSEKDRKRDRVASDEEYQPVLDKMRSPAQRVLIAQYESAMRPGEVIKLPWEFVDLKADDGERVRGFIRLPASYVKERKIGQYRYRRSSAQCSTSCGAITRKWPTSRIAFYPQRPADEEASALRSNSR